jgi:hypothetical protein
MISDICRRATTGSSAGKAVFADKRAVGFPKYLDVVLKGGDCSILLDCVEFDFGETAAQLNDNRMLVKQRRPN